MSSKDKEKKNEGTSQVPVQPQEKVDSSPQINETNATTESTAITKYDLTNDPIAQRLSNKPKAIATPTQESYAIAPPPEQPDYDAIEKGVEDKDKEQRKADAKRQRSRAIVSAVGDGLTALSNLYFTTQYAPNMNTGRGELSAKNVERWDKYVKARDAKLAEYKKTAIERADKKYENDYTRWKDDLAAKQKQQEIGIKEQAEIRAQAKMEFDQAIEKAKDERDKAKHGIEMEILDLKAKGLYTDNKIKEYEEKIKQVDSKYAESKTQAEIAYQNALTQKVKAETYAANQRGNYYKRSGSGKSSNGQEFSYSYEIGEDGITNVRINGKTSSVEELLKNLGIKQGDSDSKSKGISLTNLITHDEEGWSLK